MGRIRRVYVIVSWFLCEYTRSLKPLYGVYVEQTAICGHLQVSEKTEALVFAFQGAFCMRSPQGLGL